MDISGGPMYGPYEVEGGVAADQSCERWEAFLQESIGDPVMIRLVQEFFGYCLTTSMKYQKSLFLVGQGLGKTVLRRVLEAMVGFEKIHRCTDFYEIGDLDRQYRFFGKSVCTILQPVFIPDTERFFKWLVAGDKMVFMDSPEKSFTFHPVCKLVMEANELPRHLGPAVGTRMLAIIFEKRPINRDPLLLKQLERELPGIRAWAVEGLERLLAQDRFFPWNDDGGVFREWLCKPPNMSSNSRMRKSRFSGQRKN